LNDTHKLCPSCLVLIEKAEGCNVMTCQCGIRFCWRCGNVLAPKDGDGAYNMAAAHFDLTPRITHGPMTPAFHSAVDAARNADCIGKLFDDMAGGYRMPAV
jgi:hypothetical protein